MKYINKFTWSLILCTGLCAACSDDDEPAISGIAVDKTEIAVGPEGGTEHIGITASESWVTRITEPWLMMSPANGTGSTEGKVTVDATLEYKSRSTELLFQAADGQSQTVTVTQLGYGKHIYLKEEEVELESSADYDKRTVDCSITANVECIIQKVEYDFEKNNVELTPEEELEAAKEKTGWFLDEKEKSLEGKDLGIVLDEKARPKTVKLRCRWKMNIIPWVRVAKVYLAPKNAGDKLVNDEGEEIDHVILTVKQKAAMKIEDNRAGDSLAIILINEKVRSMYPIETSENMRNWTGVTLWEETDDNVPEGALGRVRSVAFSMVNLPDGEELPREVRYLKYLESFSIASNANSQIYNVDVCEEICDLEYLKSLTVKAYGMKYLPKNFKNLGETLEVLDLSFNNFTSLKNLTDTINPKNFPELRKLHLYGQRKNDVVIDLEESAKNGYKYNGHDLGLHFKMGGNSEQDGKEKDAFLKLLTWEKLEALELSYCFMEGELPTDEEVKAALLKADESLPADQRRKTTYSEDDFTTDKSKYREKLVGDTCRWLLTTDNPVTCRKANGDVVLDADGKEVKLTGQEVVRVLPRARAFSLNLNFFTGALPNWILFHPHFMEWRPASLIFNQQEKGKNSDGEPVGFGNIDASNFNYSYYYGDKDPGNATKVEGVAYPMYYHDYVVSGDDVEETPSTYLRRR